jgi:cell division protein ZapA (FtsZ GTPase activity inhibitor)
VLWLQLCLSNARVLVMHELQQFQKTPKRYNKKREQKERTHGGNNKKEQ